MLAAFDGRIFSGRLVGCFGWMFSLVGRGFAPICCIVPGAAKVAKTEKFRFNQFPIDLQFSKLTILLGLYRGGLRALLYEHAGSAVGLGASDEDGVRCC